MYFITVWLYENINYFFFELCFSHREVHKSTFNRFLKSGSLYDAMYQNDLYIERIANWNIN